MVIVLPHAAEAGATYHPLWRRTKLRLVANRLFVHGVKMIVFFLIQIAFGVLAACYRADEQSMSIEGAMLLPKAFSAMFSTSVVTAGVGLSLMFHCVIAQSFKDGVYPQFTEALWFGLPRSCGALDYLFGPP